MELDQVQRRDIDNLISNSLSLTIDDNLANPFVVDLLGCGFEGNNWVRVGSSLMKPSCVVDDVVSFFPCLSLSLKNITGLRLVLEGTGFVSSVGFLNLVQDVECNVSNVDVSLDLSSFEQDELNSLINSSDFKLSLVFGSDKSTVLLSKVKLFVSFTDKLQAETNAITNRLKLGIKNYKIKETNDYSITLQLLQLDNFKLINIRVKSKSASGTLYTLPQEYKPRVNKVCENFKILSTGEIITINSKYDDEILFIRSD